MNLNRLFKLRSCNSHARLRVICRKPRRSNHAKSLRNNGCRARPCWRNRRKQRAGSRRLVLRSPPSRISRLLQLLWRGGVALPAGVGGSGRGLLAPSPWAVGDLWGGGGGLRRVENVG